MKRFIDYFEILGIDPTTDVEKIKKAYHNCAKKYHPDINKNMSDEAMKKINEAYDCLKKEEDLKSYFMEYMKHKAKEEKQQEKARQEREEQMKKEKAARQQETMKEEPKRKKTILREDIKKAYKEVRKVEKGYPFIRRHKDCENVIREDLEEEENKFLRGIKRGTFHVAAEFCYQLRKFSYIGKDTVPKYVIRNRKMIGTIVMFVIGWNVLGSQKQVPVEETQTPTTKTEQVTTMEINEEKLTYELIRKYEIEAGDTLYDLEQETGVSVETIQEYNHLDTSRIVAGETIKIPYKVEKEDLKYYSSSDSLGVDSIYDFADKHNTTVGTILELNEGKIYEIDGNFVVMEDELKVPNFITKSEFKEQKEAKTYKKTK